MLTPPALPFNTETQAPDDTLHQICSCAHSSNWTSPPCRSHPGLHRSWKPAQLAGTRWDSPPSLVHSKPEACSFPGEPRESRPLQCHEQSHKRCTQSQHHSAHLRVDIAKDIGNSLAVEPD